MSSPTKTQDVRVDQFFTGAKHDSIAGALCCKLRAAGKDLPVSKVSIEKGVRRPYGFA